MSRRPDWEIDTEAQPRPDDYDFDLDRTLEAVVGLDADVAEDAFTASALGAERSGHGVLIRADGLVLTIGYLITEAERIRLTLADGSTVEGHGLGYDSETGFGFVQALTDIAAAPVPLGDSRRLRPGAPVLVAGLGGRKGTVAGEVVAREEFAGYWEYRLDAALYTTPAHPHWSGAAVIGQRGELVGVGSLQVQQQGPSGEAVVNLSVPVDLLPEDLDGFIAGLRSKPARPWLGVFSHEIGDRVVIVGVASGSPAERAGLKAGDVVAAVGEVQVSSLSDFYLALWALGPAGVEAPLTLEREQDRFDVEVKTGDRRRFLKAPRLH